MTVRELINELEKMERFYGSALPVIMTDGRPAMVELEVFPSDQTGVIAVMIF